MFVQWPLYIVCNEALVVRQRTNVFIGRHTKGSILELWTLVRASLSSMRFFPAKETYVEFISSRSLRFAVCSNAAVVYVTDPSCQNNNSFRSQALATLQTPFEGCSSELSTEQLLQSWWVRVLLDDRSEVTKVLFLSLSRSEPRKHALERLMKEQLLPPSLALQAFRENYRVRVDWQDAHRVVWLFVNKKKKGVLEVLRKYLPVKKANVLRLAASVGIVTVMGVVAWLGKDKIYEFVVQMQDQLNQQIERAKIVFREAQNRLAKTHQQMNAQVATMIQLTTNFIDAQKRAQQNAAELEALRTKINNLQETENLQFSKIKHSLEETKRALQKAAKKKHLLQQTILKQRKAIVLKTTQAAQEEEKKRMHDEQEEMQQSQQSAQQLAETQQEQLAALQRANKELLKQQEAQNQQLEQKLVALQRNYHILQQQQNEISVKEKLSHQQEAQNQQQLEQKLAALQREYNILQQTSQNQISATEKLSQQKEQKQNTQQQTIQQLEQQISTLQIANKHLKLQQTSQQEQQNQISALQQKVQEQTQTLQEDDTKLEQTTKALAELKEQLTTLETVNASLKRERELLTNEINENKQERDRTSQKLTAQEHLLQTQETTLHTLTTQASQVSTMFTESCEALKAYIFNFAPTSSTSLEVALQTSTQLTQLPLMLQVLKTSCPDMKTWKLSLTNFATIIKKISDREKHQREIWAEKAKTAENHFLQFKAHMQAGAFAEAETQLVQLEGLIEKDFGGDKDIVAFFASWATAIDVLKGFLTVEAAPENLTASQQEVETATKAIQTSAASIKKFKTQARQIQIANNNSIGTAKQRVSQEISELSLILRDSIAKLTGAQNGYEVQHFTITWKNLQKLTTQNATLVDTSESAKLLESTKKTIQPIFGQWQANFKRCVYREHGFRNAEADREIPHWITSVDQWDALWTVWDNATQTGALKDLARKALTVSMELRSPFMLIRKARKELDAYKKLSLLAQACRAAQLKHPGDAFVICRELQSHWDAMALQVQHRMQEYARQRLLLANQYATILKLAPPKMADALRTPPQLFACDEIITQYENLAKNRVQIYLRLTHQASQESGQFEQSSQHNLRHEGIQYGPFKAIFGVDEQPVDLIAPATVLQQTLLHFFDEAAHSHDNIIFLQGTNLDVVKCGLQMVHKSTGKNEPLLISAFEIDGRANPTHTAMTNKILWWLAEPSFEQHLKKQFSGFGLQHKVLHTELSFRWTTAVPLKNIDSFFAEYQTTREKIEDPSSGFLIFVFLVETEQSRNYLSVIWLPEPENPLLGLKRVYNEEKFAGEHKLKEQEAQQKIMYYIASGKEDTLTGVCKSGVKCNNQPFYEWLGSLFYRNEQLLHLRRHMSTLNNVPNVTFASVPALTETGRWLYSTETMLYPELNSSVLTQLVSTVLTQPKSLSKFAMLFQVETSCSTNPCDLSQQKQTLGFAQQFIDSTQPKER